MIDLPCHQMEVVMLDTSYKGEPKSLEQLLEPLVFWGLVRIRRRKWPRLARASDRLWDEDPPYSEEFKKPALEIVRLIREFVQNERSVRRLWIDGSFQVCPNYRRKVVEFVSEVKRRLRYTNHHLQLRQDWRWTKLIHDIANTRITVTWNEVVVLVAIELSELDAKEKNLLSNGVKVRVVVGE